jgi:hypothetical protein
MQRVDQDQRKPGMSEKDPKTITIFGCDGCWNMFEQECSCVGVQRSKVLMYSRHSKCDSS